MRNKIKTDEEKNGNTIIVVVVNGYHYYWIATNMDEQQSQINIAKIQ